MLLCAQLPADVFAACVVNADGSVPLAVCLQPCAHGKIRPITPFAGSVRCTCPCAPGELPLLLLDAPVSALHDVNNDYRFLLSHLTRTGVFALMVSLPALLLYCDIHWLGDGVGEWSLVELTQEGFLLASVLAFVRLARRRVEDRRFAVLAAGLFACMLLREMDALFDLLLHGLWKWVAVPVAMGCLFYASRQWRAALSGLVRFLNTRAGTLMTIGLVLLLCYARLIGLTSLWQGLLDDSYIRVFKNAIEETTELLGYTFILAGSLAHVAQRLRAPAVQPAGGATAESAMRRL